MSPELEPVRLFLEKYGFEADGVTELLEFHEENAIKRAFPFPWKGIEEHLNAEGGEDLFLVGYGSLLNPSSAARTIRDTPVEGHRPIIAVGAKRIFNYVIPEAVFIRYGIPPGEKDRAALNAEPWTIGVLNGRLIRFSSEDIAGLREREKAYDLHPVSCAFWNDRKCKPFSGYVLCCQSEYYHGERFLDNSLIPYQPYYDLCRKGADLVSDEFLRFYLETTFLADRKISMSEMEETGPGID